MPFSVMALAVSWGTMIVGIRPALRATMKSSCTRKFGVTSG